MTNKRTLFVVILATVVLAACSSVPPKPIGKPDIATWHQRRARLQTLDSWQLNGHIGVSHDGEGSSGSIVWHENAPHFSMLFSGPFGVGGFQLHGTPSALFIEQDGKTRYSAHPELFLSKTLGGPLPLKSLRYWVLGLPDPAAQATVLVDEDGLVRRLSQYGWVIHYDRFQKSDGWTLPAKLEATRGSVKIKMTIDQWGIAQQQIIFD